MGGGDMIAALRKIWGRVSTPSARRGYDGARVGRLMGDWAAATRTTPVEELTPSAIRMLRGRARDLERNSPIVQNWLATLCAQTLGDSGLRLRARVKVGGALDDARGGAIEEVWDEWASLHADASGQQSWVGLQNLILRAVARDGGALVRLIRGAANPYRFAVQVIDADCIGLDYNRRASGGAREIIQGVELDEWRRPVAFHLETADGRQSISARECIYIRRQDRAGEVHSAPWCASVITSLRMLDSYREAELTAARLSACKVGFYVRSESGEGFSGAESAGGAQMEELAPGSFQQLPAGVDFKAFDPQHPNVAFGEFNRCILRSIAGGLGVSYHELAQDAESVNFSSLRAFTITERDRYAALQTWLAHALAPVWRAWLEMATLAGKVESADVRADMVGRRWGWINPLQDVRAGVEQLAAGLVSRRQLVAQAGGDWFQTVQEIAGDKAAAEALGLKLSGEIIGDVEDEESEN